MAGWVDPVFANHIPEAVVEQFKFGWSEANIVAELHSTEPGFRTRSGLMMAFSELNLYDLIEEYKETVDHGLVSNTFARRMETLDFDLNGPPSEDG